MVSLEEDVFREILLRLPSSSLVLFKSVSNRWNSLISDTSFVHQHFLRNRLSDVHGKFLLKISLHGRSPQHQYISLNEHIGTSSSSASSLVALPVPARIDVTQSCNGLLCGKSYTTYGGYYIFNPSTKCCRILPPSKFRNLSLTGLVCSMSLVFDSKNAKHYLVVCVMKTEYKNKYQMGIYSSETKEWRLSGEPFASARDTYDKPGVYWNGNLHWIRNWIDYSRFDIKQESSKLLLQIPDKIISYDLNRRSFKDIFDLQYIHRTDIAGPKYRAYHYIDSIASV